MRDNEPIPLLLTVPQAAFHLGCGKTSAYAMIKRGDLEAVRDPLGRLRVPRHAIEAICNDKAA